MTLLSKIGGWTPRCGAETWVPAGDSPLEIRPGGRVSMPAFGQEIGAVCDIVVVYTNGTFEVVKFRRES